MNSQIETGLARSSEIRKMFEAGIALRARYGADRVYDFSLGNPQFEPPVYVQQTMARLIDALPAGLHGYMPSAGHRSTRLAIADFVAKRDNLEVTADHIVMSVGAAGGLNVVFRSLLNPGDEVIVIAPYFVEYLSYLNNYGAQAVVCQSAEDFSLDCQQLEKCLTARTRAVLLNSPNNPTGVIYDDETIGAVAELLNKAQKKYNSIIHLVADDIYRHIVYDGKSCPSVASYYDNSLVVTSFSKDLALAGERIGYIYLSPSHQLKQLADAFAYTSRIMGFINAPSFMQKVVESVVSEPIDIEFLANKRARIAKILNDAGLQVTMPDGAFYFFLPVPGINNDQEFCKFMREKFRILLVSGSSFGRPGYFRLSYAVADQVIDNSRQPWCDGVGAWM